MGDSAGGQLALATTLRLKKFDLHTAPADSYLLNVDPNGSSNSYVENGSDYIITANMLLSGFELYAGVASPVYCMNRNQPANASFHGLPTTTIITAEFDPLRDEGEQLYRSIAAQGVEARYEPYLG